MPSASSTNYLVESELNYLLKGVAFTRPTNIWIGLFTTTPNLDSSGGVEVSTSGTGYGRISIDSATGWAGPSGTNRTYSNGTDLVYGIPTANWGTVVSAGAFTAQTGGEILLLFSFPAPKTVNNGDAAPRIPQGGLTISRSVC